VSTAWRIAASIVPNLRDVLRVCVSAAAAGLQTVAGLPTIRRPDDILEPVHEADPNARPVDHHRTVDSLGILLRSNRITHAMHDAARDFQAQYTVAHFDSVRCMSLMRLPGSAGVADFTDAQLDARRRVGMPNPPCGGGPRNGRSDRPHAPARGYRPAAVW
jgi:hypothetical protein